MSTAHLLAQDAPAQLPGWAVLLIILCVFVLPFVLGYAISAALKLRDLSTRIGIVLFTVVLGLTPFVTEMATGGTWRDAIRLGIDLEGGTNLVYKIDVERAAQAEKEIDAELRDRMVAAISRRINPTGTEEVTVRSVGDESIEIIMPGADPERVEAMKRQITRLGSLEFAILANRFEHEAIIEEALQSQSTEVRRGNQVIAAWRPVGVDSEGKPRDIGEHDGVVSRTVERDGQEVKEFLIVLDPDPERRITGRLLRRAYETVSESGPVVGFTFNTEGGYLFQQLTARYQPKAGTGYKNRLAILLDERIFSAPAINSIISTNGIIEGDFTRREINELINVLNAGALEVPLVQDPAREYTISPTLGIDIQEKGKTAIIWAAIVVFVFMLVYYLYAGLIADVCLVVNIILVLGVMSLIDATFTLPGLAGLVLTIGMAVDANVLIFERIREEQHRGSSLRLAIKNGFGKALSTIVDANVTTLITAIVLYMIGTEQVQGFAVTLFIGIVMSMFTALYVGRLLFDITERKRWVRHIKMLSIVGDTRLDFLGKKAFAVVASVALIAVGMGAFFVRGEDNFDIDFRGGSMVTFMFSEQGQAPTVDEARELLDATFDTGITLERLQVPDLTTGEVSELFRLRTIEPDADKVSRQVSEAFADSPFDLIRQDITFGDVAQVEGEDEVESLDEEAVFIGGYRAPVDVALPVTPETLSEEAAAALRSLTTDEDEPKYPDPLALVEAEPTEETETLKSTSFNVYFSPVVSELDVTAALQAMRQSAIERPFFEEKNTFDRAVAGQTQVDAVLAMLVSLIAIVGYIWIRFQRITFGLAAVAALVHDVLCVLGIVALASYASGNPIGSMLGLVDFKINLPMIAAFLTIVGYSLNDTIVVFDRIREVRGKNPALTEDMVNRSLNQTLSRTLLTSLTTMIVVLILYAIGGEGIHGFAFCLVMGVLVGTYSSIYVAAPVLLWLTNRRSTPTSTPVKSAAATV